MQIGTTLLRVLFAFRMIMLIGSVGALVGAFLMFWQGILYLAEAWNVLLGSAAEHAPAVAEAAGHGVAAVIAEEEHEVSQITVPVLEAIDSFLFGVVLVIFCYSIAVGFVFRLPASVMASLPSWMKVDGVGQLKQILAEVVIVVLIVIFARVVVEAGGSFSWELLILPISVILFAGAIWLLELGSHGGEENHAPPIEPAQKTALHTPAPPKDHA